ncbi:VTT domain-containing protein [Paraglaciecola sp. Hal342]
MLFSTGAMAIGCPRQVMAFLGGYAFGFLQGALLSVSGAICGCMVSFFVARFLLKPVVRRRYASRIHSINRFVEDSPVTKTIIIRLLPLGSNFLTNLMAGVTNVKARHFILGSGLGYIPQMALFALMGKAHSGNVYLESRFKCGNAGYLCGIKHSFI